MQEDLSSNFPQIRPPFPEHEHLKCPRCDSINTKFCYYNNYNLSQPRHFCKNCRRYWTKGGTLRNVPVGGGTRKNVKRPSDKKNSSSSSSSNVPTLSPASPPRIPSSFGNEMSTLGFSPLLPSDFLETEEDLNIGVGGGGGRNNSGDKLNLLGVELGDGDFSGTWADHAIYTSAGATYL